MCCIEFHTLSAYYMHQVSFQPPGVLEDNDHIIMQANDCHAGCRHGAPINSDELVILLDLQV